MMPEACQRGTEPAQICVTSERKPGQQALERLILVAEEDEFGARAMGVDIGLVEGGVLEAGIVEDQQVLREGGRRRGPRTSPCRGSGDGS
jgi:hypothetical protein